jgi:glycosyltransferase involved in cell wall biosynthesis
VVDHDSDPGAAPTDRARDVAAGPAPQRPGPRLLALIPAHDEAPRIGPVIAEALRHLPVLVVDDGSTDDTAGVAEAAGARVIVQRPNRGKGAALRTGFAAALADGCDGVVTLDADGQHDPAEIPRFVGAFGHGATAPTTATDWGDATAPAPAAATDGDGATVPAEATPRRPDLVVGRRDFRHMPPVRRLSNEIGGRAFSWSVGRRIPDNQSGYRLVGARLMRALADSDEQGFAFEVEMITTCVREGWPIAWVPIRTIYAGEPSHIRPIAHFREFVGICRKARREVRSGHATRETT